MSVYIDDLLVSGESEEEHLKTLGRVLTRLQEADLKLKRSKCSFMVSTVEYLGHVISEKGIRPTEEKTKAIVNAPTPQNETQLKSFLGLLNYYGKFLPHLASVLAPLYTLLKKGTPWYWGKKQNQAFRRVKEHLISAKVLTHFDPGKKLLLACDASPYGVAAVLSPCDASPYGVVAVLSHQMEDGSDRPIVFVSRTLTPAEKKYSQLEKEGLAVVFGVCKFSQYLMGRSFTILSDHKPLQYLFSADHPVPVMASARIQRWALTLSAAYQYDIAFKAGSLQGNVDALSRLPLEETPSSTPYLVTLSSCWKPWTAVAPSRLRRSSHGRTRILCYHGCVVLSCMGTGSQWSKMLT